MANNNYPEINIGDFAEQLLNQEVQQIQEGTKPRPNLNNTIQEHTDEVQNQRDISNVVVPDDLMEMWTGKKQYNLNKVIEQESPEVISEEITNVDKLSNALSKLSEAISETQTALKEMCGAVTPGTTTVGHIGVNMAGAKSYDTSKKKKKKKKKKKTPESIIKEALLDYLGS